MWRTGFALGIAGTLVNAAEIPFTKCGEDLLGVSRVIASDYPLPPGSDVSLSVVFSPTKDIEAGKLDMVLSMRGMKIFEQSYDICEDSGLVCPLPSGTENVAKTSQTVPPGAPSVTMEAHIVATDAAGNQLSCINTELEIGAYSKEHLQSLPAVSSALLTDIAMSPNLKWKAHWSPRFATANLHQASTMCGTILKGHPIYMDLPVKEDFDANVTIPDTFDARENWPECREIIGHVRDQSSCGSCWSCSTTEAFNDRMCITHGLKELLSITDTMSCCSGLVCGGSQGCNGGQPAGAWAFFQEFGIVSGGDYTDIGKGQDCLPYPFVSCAHHVDPTPEIPACPAEDFETPRCVKHCSESEYDTMYPRDKVKSKTAYSVRGVSKIQQEIMENGPVSAAMTVYNDFLTYESGVYHHVSGSPLGGHAIKVVGWGVEDGTPYWLAVNSWNDQWGDGGTFKILRGSDECGFESQITAGGV